MPVNPRTPKNRLGEARKKAGYTQKAVSDETGIPLGTIRRWEQGQNDPDMSSLVTLAKLYGTSLDYILENKPANQQIATGEPGDSDGFVDVPLYGSIAAGTPIEMMEIDDTHPVPIALTERHPDAFLLLVEGNSMNRVLPNGSYALIDPCDEVTADNKPHAVCVNGYSATIKRVRKLANGFELAPDSIDPTYKPVVYDYGVEGTETITIIGRVVWYCVPFDWEF